MSEKNTQETGSVVRGELGNLEEIPLKEVSCRGCGSKSYQWDVNDGLVYYCKMGCYVDSLNAKTRTKHFHNMRSRATAITKAEINYIHGRDDDENYYHHEKTSIREES